MRGLQPFQGWRLTFFQGVIVAVFAIFAIRMYDLQVLSYDYFTQQAEGNRLNELPEPAPRGVIYDRYNKPMAKNAAAYLVEIVPAQLPDDQAGRYAIYNRISALVNVPPTLNSEIVNGQRVRSIERMVNEGEGIAPFQPVPIAADVDRRAAMRILEERIDTPGVSVRPVSVREYPSGQLTAHIVGYMGPIGPAEAERLRELGYNPNFDRIGYDGVEAYLESELAGVRGSTLRELDVVGEVQRVINIRPPVAGQSVRLTIDLELQAAAQQALVDQLAIINELSAQTTGAVQSETGVVIAVNPMTGEILAMVSYPSYDNTRFARAIDGEYYLEVLNNPLTPLVNHAIGSLYPPGSSWKLITAAGAMEEQIISPTSFLFDGGDLIVENRYAPNEPSRAQRFVCHDRAGHGNVDMIRAISLSCNVYFYQVGGGNPKVSQFVLKPDGLGIDNLVRYATALGIGSELGVELPGEIAGRMPDRDWKRITYGENWSTGDTYNAAFGQGYITVTPLQMITSVQALVTGRLYQPTLVREFLTESGQVVQPFEPIVMRTINLDQANEDGTITLLLVEDMIMKGRDSLACTCEPGTDMYNPLRCNPDGYRNTVDITPNDFLDEPITYRVHVPYNYSFNASVCDTLRFDSSYIPAFVSEASLSIVRQGMREAVVNGTSRAAALSYVNLGGKTGTAEYCDNIAFPLGLCVPGNWPAHAWFTGYGPYENPEILVIAFIYNGKEGSSNALPVVRSTIEAYFRLKAEREGTPLPGGGSSDPLAPTRPEGVPSGEGATPAAPTDPLPDQEQDQASNAGT